MTVKEVMVHYHKIVPFPITPKKIEAAGYDTIDYLINIKQDLERCVDCDDLPAAKIIQAVSTLQQLVTN